MLVHWIWLATRCGVSDRQKRAVLEACGDAEDVYFADGESYQTIAELSPQAKDALLDKNLAEAESILTQCTDKNIQVCTFHDSLYPVRLKHIADPPLVLYYKGTIPQMDAAPVITVVGTRESSLYGNNVARRMGYQIAACGGIVVSGVAKGIDGMAMQGALLAGGMPPFEAAQGACLWHGMAGLEAEKQFGTRGVLTGNVADALGKCLTDAEGF